MKDDDEGKMKEVVKKWRPATPYYYKNLSGEVSKDSGKYLQDFTCNIPIWDPNTCFSSQTDQTRRVMVQPKYSECEDTVNCCNVRPPNEYHQLNAICTADEVDRNLKFCALLNYYGWIHLEDEVNWTFDGMKMPESNKKNSCNFKAENYHDNFTDFINVYV